MFLNNVAVLAVSTKTSLNKKAHEVSVNWSQYLHVVMKNHKTYCRFFLIHFYCFPTSRRIFLLLLILINNLEIVALGHQCKDANEGKLVFHLIKMEEP